MTVAKLGMRGTGSWGTDVRPKNFREMILKLFPNGAVPLTAVLSMGKSKEVDDPEFSHWEKEVEVQGGDGQNDDLYVDSDLTTLFGTGAWTAGDTAYFRTDSTTVTHFRAGHVAKLVDKSATSNFALAKVTGTNINGNSSWIAVKILVTLAAGFADDLDYIEVGGNLNPEGGAIPDAVNYDPVKRTNFTQIFRNPLDISRTAKKTRLRTGDAKAELKRETLLYHGIEMEWAMIFGEKSENTGDNGFPERTTEGLVPFVINNESTYSVDFPSSTGLKWIQGGEDWLDDQMELHFRAGGQERFALCGNGALLGIHKLVKRNGNYELRRTTAAYGVMVVEWVTPFGTLFLKNHPMFSHRGQVYHNDIISFDPANVEYTFITDTIYKEDDGMSKAGVIGFDGQKDEYLTEAGLRMSHPKTMMYLTGVGNDGTA